MEETSTFCARVWAETAALQEAIATHPFNVGLADGTLERDRFAHYLAQDAHYLEDFSRALSVAASRAPDSATAAVLAGSAHHALVVERSLHAGYLDRWGVTSAAVAPTCEAYGSYLQALALRAPFGVLVAGLLPCFWIYQEVGTAIHQRTEAMADHPYRAWIDTYADEGFAATVAQVRAIADQAATGADQVTAAAMRAAFRRASEYEWMFWDAAWRQERWPTERWV